MGVLAGAAGARVAVAGEEKRTCWGDLPLPAVPERLQIGSKPISMWGSQNQGTFRRLTTSMSWE